MYRDGKEKDIAEGKFGIPIWLVLIFIAVFLLALFGFVYSLVTLISSLSVDLDTGISSSADPALLGILIAVSFVCSNTFIFIIAPWLIGMKRSEFVITDRRISGVIDRFYIKRRFDVSLLHIEKASIFTTLKMPGLSITIPAERKAFKIRWLRNANAMYAYLYDAVEHAQHRRETLVEINEFELPGQEAAPAEKPAPKEKEEPKSGMNYIEELKGLKELLDIGAITSYEYETRKRALMK